MKKVVCPCPFSSAARNTPAPGKWNPARLERGALDAAPLSKAGPGLGRFSANPGGRVRPGQALGSGEPLLPREVGRAPGRGAGPPPPGAVPGRKDSQVSPGLRAFSAGPNPVHRCPQTPGIRGAAYPGRGESSPGEV